MSVSRVPQLRIGQQDLKCRQGCGYYGNAQSFDGLCSKCYRERNDRKKRGNLLKIFVLIFNILILSIVFSEKLLNATTTGKIDPSLPTSSATSSSGGTGRSSPQNLLGRSPSKKQRESSLDSPSTAQGTLTKKKSLVPAVFQRTLNSSAQKCKCISI